MRRVFCWKFCLKKRLNKNFINQVIPKTNPINFIPRILKFYRLNFVNKFAKKNEITIKNRKKNNEK